MLAIARTTPALLGLFSLVTIWMHGLIETRGANIGPRTAGWYGKPELTFSDAIATVRCVLWCRRIGCPGTTRKSSKSPPDSSEDSPRLATTPHEMRKFGLRLESHRSFER